MRYVAQHCGLQHACRIVLRLRHASKDSDRRLTAHACSCRLRTRQQTSRVHLKRMATSWQLLSSTSQASPSLPPTPRLATHSCCEWHFLLDMRGLVVVAAPPHPRFHVCSVIWLHAASGLRTAPMLIMPLHLHQKLSSSAHESQHACTRAPHTRGPVPRFQPAPTYTATPPTQPH